MALSRRTGRSRFTLRAAGPDARSRSSPSTSADAGVVDDARARRRHRLLAGARRRRARCSEPFTNAWNGVIDYGDLEDENERLREQIAELEGAGRVEADAAASSSTSSRPARGICRSRRHPHGRRPGWSAGRSSNFAHTIEIDKGSDDGIEEGMPVVTGAGLSAASCTCRRRPVHGPAPHRPRLRRRRAARAVRRPSASPTVSGDGRPLVVEHPRSRSVVDRRRASRSPPAARPQRLPARHPGRQVSTVGRADRRPARAWTSTVEPLADLDGLAFVTRPAVGARRRDPRPPGRAVVIARRARCCRRRCSRRAATSSACHGDVMLLLVRSPPGSPAGPSAAPLVGFAAGLAFDLLLQTPFGLSALVVLRSSATSSARSRTSVLRAAWWIPVATAIAGERGRHRRLYALRRARCWARSRTSSGRPARDRRWSSAVLNAHRWRHWP